MLQARVDVSRKHRSVETGQKNSRPSGAAIEYMPGSGNTQDGSPPEASVPGATVWFTLIVPATAAGPWFVPNFAAVTVVPVPVVAYVIHSATQEPSAVADRVISNPIMVRFAVEADGSSNTTFAVAATRATVPVGTTYCAVILPYCSKYRLTYCSKYKLLYCSKYRLILTLPAATAVNRRQRRIDAGWKNSRPIG